MAPKMSGDRSAAVRMATSLSELYRAETNFRRACDQIVLMNGLLRDLGRRYKRARAQDLRSFRYNQRLRLAAVEGVRSMYYDYATQKAEDVQMLREALEVGGDSVYNSEEESSEEM